ncbi:MAG: TolC family protein [Acidobacteria bacterium]|nr:TolC family protein [Acidobacteriota bacterium]
MSKTITLLTILTALLSGSFRAALAQDGERLTLKRAVSLALENSRELELARAQVAVSERAIGVNVAQFRPNLFTGSGAAYTHGFPQTPGGAPSVFNLSYVQTLFNPVLRGQLREMETRREIRGLDVERARESVIERTVSAFLELAKVRHTLELLRSENASAQRIFEVTRSRADEGLELPIELTRAQLTTARIEQRLIQMESREDTLIHLIRDLTALPQGQPLEIVREELPPLGEQPIPELIAIALENNLDVRQAEIERRARENVLQGQRGGYWPSVDLVGQYNIWSRFNNFDDFYRTFERNNLNIGVQVQIPIFSAKTRAAVALARSELAESEVSARNKRADLTLEVRRRGRHLRELGAAREVARLELKLAQENVALLHTRLEEGKANLRDVEKARLEENDRWLTFLDADFDRQQAQLELLKATGQLTKAFP